MLTARTHILLRVIAITVIALAATVPSSRHKNARASVEHSQVDRAQLQADNARGGTAVAKR